MRVISFIDYTPSPRFDGHPWTKLRIEESVAVDGATWNTIDLVNLLPVDDDPSEPMARDFTTDNASDDLNLWYRIIFADATNNEELPTAPVQNKPDIIQEYLPTVGDVGKILRARTVDINGNELGTFTEDTRPTGEQVSGLIRLAAADVTAETDTDIPPAAWDAAENLITLGAGMRVEMSYFPQQVGTPSSNYDRLKDMYDQSLIRLQRAVERESIELETGEQTEVPGPYTDYDPPMPVNWDEVVW